MSNKHIIVISIDALITSDLEAFSKKPNMGRLLKNSSRVDEIHCIYPTYTYPCHTTIMTGCYPDKHGIYHNERFDINKNTAEWFWYAKDIKVPTMIDIANKAGVSTACITFPVQGGSKADYLISEIWQKKESDDPTPVFDSVNSPKVKHIFDKNKHLLNWLKTPEFDYFASACATDIIKEFNPELTFLHFSYLDHQRHQCGAGTEKVMHAIDFIDDRIGEIIKATDEMGTFESTDFVLLGDHGHIDARKIFNINKALQERSLIKTNDKNEIIDWNIYAHSSSFSAQVYTKNIDKKEAKRILDEIREEYPEYIERVLDKLESREVYHLDGPFDFVMEAQTHTIFGEKTNAELVEIPKEGNYRFSLSSHGFAPEKGPNPPFVLSGPDAIKGRIIERARLVDEAPTIMSLLGLAMPDDIDGKVIEGLIK